MKPRLLDLFCGAGGAAKGYVDAGFEVVGVDLIRQPNFPGQEPMLKKRTPGFTFKQADALEFLASPQFELWGFDAIHASPPCQLYSHGTVSMDRSNYSDLIGPTRNALVNTGLPYIIENVPRAPLLAPAIMCGSSLPSVRDHDGQELYLRRHRHFESNFPITSSPCFCVLLKKKGYKVGGVYGGGRRNRWEAENVRHGGYCPPFEIQCKLMNIDWMTQKELNQAIPPAYTEFIGTQLLQFLGTPEGQKEGK